MGRMTFSPLTFLITGFSWLLLSSLLGLAILVGLVRGTPLPPWLQLVHVHAALVGGVAQMIAGGFLSFIPPLLMTGHKRPHSHPVLFLALNLGATGMLVGFGLHQFQIVGAAGLLVIGAFLSIARDAWSQARQSLSTPPLNFWYYVVALIALVAGLACGETMAFGLSAQSYAYVRLAHIHLNLLGFVTLAIIGTMHNLLPTLLNTPLYSHKLARIVLILMPLGVALLIGGFMNSSIPIELAAGSILLAGVILYAVNLFRTWLTSPRTGTAASDHLLTGTFFLLLSIVLGILVGANSLSNPPLMPFGTLHLIAYTHIALVGFVFQTIWGVLSHMIPVSLSVSREPSNKKRGPYLDRLMQIMNRWRSLQIIGLSMGTLGLALLATLTWSVPLSSFYVQLALWNSFGLLLGSLAFFVARLTQVFNTYPEE
ncbi:MAG: cbb3-type cytochrome c oxidase subunit I [Nitrospira sp.]|nr:cbb3-type cytochrome c oxidase subunit I [Nitrospira sp.]